MIRFTKKSANEVRKEDNLYLVGPFWIIADSLSSLNSGNFEIIAKKFLVDYDGNYDKAVTRPEFTHKGIQEKEYQSLYPNKAYDYFPRGRVSWDAKDKKIWVNIPRGLNEKAVLPEIAKIYDFDLSLAIIKYTDPASGNHYSFRLQ